mmetsp:Transcript_30924/g.71834  ORF Transcript_30924/g.71834 Transcript_30924/m.71834 type:complete len:283 (+) Transcript_30924:92-940(+)
MTSKTRCLAGRASASASSSAVVSQRTDSAMARTCASKTECWPQPKTFCMLQCICWLSCLSIVDNLLAKKAGEGTLFHVSCSLCACTFHSSVRSPPATSPEARTAAQFTSSPRPSYAGNDSCREYLTMRGFATLKMLSAVRSRASMSALSPCAGGPSSPSHAATVSCRSSSSYFCTLRKPSSTRLMKLKVLLLRPLNVMRLSNNSISQTASSLARSRRMTSWPPTPDPTKHSEMLGWWDAQVNLSRYNGTRPKFMRASRSSDVIPLTSPAAACKFSRVRNRCL